MVSGGEYEGWMVSPLELGEVAHVYLVLQSFLLSLKDT